MYIYIYIYIEDAHSCILLKDRLANNRKVVFYIFQYYPLTSIFHIESLLQFKFISNKHERSRIQMRKDRWIDAHSSVFGIDLNNNK